MKKRILIALLAVLAAPASPAFADDSGTAVPAALTPAQKADIVLIQNYLNSLKNVTADFLQVDDAGGMLHGKMAISRPGKMRATYDPPDKDFVIADGDFVHIWNNDLKAQTNVEEGSSLAEFILRDPVKLSGDVTVTKFQTPPGLIDVTLEQTKDPAAGSLTLVFDNNPIELRQWKVVDAEGHMTGVTLDNMTKVANFPDNYFFFVAPTFDNPS
ncbi:MAG: outer-membrane lipoprotein carrier protein LolA [Alphaproteobacteria bacterium]|nr:outer-membrane lipoprotein carrier protein LolA [Alphaproteobacteria bacterium]